MKTAGSIFDFAAVILLILNVVAFFIVLISLAWGQVLPIVLIVPIFGMVVAATLAAIASYLYTL